MVVRIDSSEVRTLAVQLGMVPPTLRRRLRPKLREAAEEVAREVRANSSWSSRIPGATRVHVGFGSRGGVRVDVDSGAAPHARPLEFGNFGAFNRHPVFGGPAYVNQPVRPFFMRGVRAKEEVVVQRVKEAVGDALRVVT